MAPLVELELDAISTADELHRVLADTLGFPAFYGMNWDAFWDCITDPQLSSMPVVLRIRGWESLRARVPRDAQMLREQLDDLGAERQDCRVEWL